MDNAPGEPIERGFQAEKLVLDLRAPGEESEGASLASSRFRALFTDEDKFVTEWSYYPGADEAAGSSLRSCTKARNSAHK